MTVSGRRLQYASRRSTVDAPVGRASRRSAAICSVRSRRAVTARWVNTPVTRRRYRVWSGGSLTSSDGGWSGLTHGEADHRLSRANELRRSGAPVRKSGEDSTARHTAWSTLTKASPERTSGPWPRSSSRIRHTSSGSPCIVVMTSRPCRSPRPADRRNTAPGMPCESPQRTTCRERPARLTRESLRRARDPRRGPGARTGCGTSSPSRARHTVRRRRWGCRRRPRGRPGHGHARPRRR